MRACLQLPIRLIFILEKIKFWVISFKMEFSLYEFITEFDINRNCNSLFFSKRAADKNLARLASIYLCEHKCQAIKQAFNIKSNASQMGFNCFIALAYITSCTGIHGHQQMDQNKTEQRPWGRFTVLNEGPAFKVKQVELGPGNRIGLQSHEGRDEYWTFVSGEGVLSLGTPDGNALRQIHVSVGKQVKIPKRVKHRVEALSHLVFIEIQIGHCEESDIIRYSDDYGRVVK